ncbi:hypothetical protein SAMN05443572_104730 [Myxococcus fulvus]|uniref:DUF6310 domain-containing protein n=1 Tax=Myxococcus fulvus TaxID=33 RepID=A0A511SXK9_MYXFU|nr:DUF6310 domain-containing protein [Myxococcus fulvus]GEN06636.1 hypothetical protein MFU01_16730 [Myxococcus fulvus]SEU07348.1 hypothetical protein SAMN05443572_104730 [Myxococcus fulvus]
MERCYQALDHDRIEFHDTTGRCSVASTGAAALGIGLCILAAPEIATGAVIVLGVMVVGVAIKEALDAYEFRHAYPEEAGNSRGTKVSSQEAGAHRKHSPKPGPSGQDWQPPLPPVSVNQTGRASCEPVPVPHAGEDAPHNSCADRFPPNRYPGMDVLVGGKRFDALQVGASVLWEIKTHQFNTYTDFLQEQVVRDQVEEFLADRGIAQACGYRFAVGVSDVEHKQALLDLEPSLAQNIVVTGCKR